MKPRIEGGCLCGRVRYELLGEPRELGDCHCIDCQRASGAPYVTWGTVAREERRIVAGVVKRVAHAGRLRTFAACCGTPLFFEEDAEAAMVDVTIATLDEPGGFAPRHAIWTEDRLPWVQLNEERPSYRQRRVEG